LRKVELGLRFVGLAADRFLRNLGFAVNINLLPLKFQISFHDTLDCAHVWAAVEVKCFHELCHIVRILPLFDSFEEAEVDEDDARRPTNPRRTMNINIQAHIIDHIIQMLRNHK